MSAHPSDARSEQRSRWRVLSERAIRFAAFSLLLLTTATTHSAAPQPPAARGLLLDATLNGHAILAVGERGAIIRSVDSGDTWETIASPTRATLTGIAFGTPLSGWAVGHDGVILHTRDGGETWSEQFQATDRETVFLDVAAVDSSRAIAVGAFGTCYYTRDSGRTWLSQKINDADNHLNRLTRGHDSELFIAGERGTLLHSPSFNTPPTPLVSPDDISFYGLLPLSDTTLLAYGLRGHLFRSTDKGQSWKLIESPQPALFATALKLKSGLVLVAGQARAFAVSRDAGLTFQAWLPPMTTAIAELLEAPNGQLLAFGEAGVTHLDPPDTLPLESASPAPATP
jgi:photosystem II stability/assembly factor-like uncharacterized protein